MLGTAVERQVGAVEAELSEGAVCRLAGPKAVDRAVSGIVDAGVLAVGLGLFVLVVFSKCHVRYRGRGGGDFDRADKFTLINIVKNC